MNATATGYGSKLYFGNSPIGQVIHFTRTASMRNRVADIIVGHLIATGQKFTVKRRRACEAAADEICRTFNVEAKR